MADKKISQLTGASTPLAGTEELPIVQSGNTKKVTVSNLTAGRAVLASAVGVNVSPATQIHAVGSNVNLGTLELDSDASVDYVGLTMWTKKTVPNANSRNWQVAANYQGFGTFDIMNSTTTTGNPTTARLSMDNVGNTTLNTGNLVIGTAGKGIDFSATPGTGTSELLNDYEEGTWTVAWTNLTGTPTNLTGYYTKIGRLVTFSYDTGAGIISGTAGSVRFTLPFTPAQGSAGSTITAGPANPSSNWIYTDGLCYPMGFGAAFMTFSGSYIV
jgi:hypothetical protein